MKTRWWCGECPKWHSKHAWLLTHGFRSAMVFATARPISGGSGDGRERDDDSDPDWLPEGVLADPADLAEANIDEPKADEADEDDEDYRRFFLESYGAELDAPWSPVPLGPARAFLREVPEARLQTIFDPIFTVDRSQLVKDALALEGSDILSRRRVSAMLASAFDASDFDYETEQQTIAEERARFGGELGSGDAFARRAAGVPGEGDEEDEPAYNSAPERSAFRRRQRETVKTVFIERDERGLIRALTEKPGEPPPGFDAERFYREKRETLQERAKATSAPAPEPPQPPDAAHERRVALRRAIIHEGKALAKRLREMRERQERKLLTKTEVSYRYAEPSMQKAAHGQVLESCGRCDHFIAPDACEIVEPPIRKLDTCNRFMPKRKAAR